MSRTTLPSLKALLGFLAIFTSTAFAELEGVWGGKWDDAWPVFLEVRKGIQPDTLEVAYIWLENTEHAEFSRRNSTAKRVGDHYETGVLIFKIEGDRGMLHGAFRNPRMANLVRIAPGVPAADDSDAALHKAGWKANAIPAAKAKELIEQPAN